MLPSKKPMTRLPVLPKGKLSWAFWRVNLAGTKHALLPNDAVLLQGPSLKPSPIKSVGWVLRRVDNLSDIVWSAFREAYDRFSRATQADPVMGFTEG